MIEEHPQLVAAALFEPWINTRALLAATPLGVTTRCAVRIRSAAVNLHTS